MRARTLRPPLPSRPSWWLEEARVHAGAEVSPPLDGPLDVDVAVVGGGYTGLWTALAVRERDPSLSVALLEAREIGDGPSGRNGGFLHGYWSSLATLRAVLGDGGALQLAHASSRIIPAVRAFAEARGEDLWLREAGLLKVAATPVEDSAVGRSVRAANELGVEEEARALDEADVRRFTDSPRFRMGVFFRDGATVQPARLVLALRRAAIAQGVLLFERTPVTRVAPGTLETPSGSVRAREIVLALNVWGTSWPLAGRQTNFGSAVVLTEPVPELLEEIGWTGGEAITDGRMFLHYFRTTPDGRVLMGSGSGRLGLGDRVGPGILDDLPAQARAERGLRELLPGLGARLDRRPLERADRRLGRQASALRHGAGNTTPLRRGLLGQRCRAELARWADPRLARARHSGRMDRAAARRPPGPAPAARAVPLRRRKARPLGHPGVGGGGCRRPAAIPCCTCRSSDPTPAEDADRHALNPPAETWSTVPPWIKAKIAIRFPREATHRHL